MIQATQKQLGVRLWINPSSSCTGLYRKS